MADTRKILEAVDVIKRHLEKDWISDGCKTEAAFGCISCQAVRLSQDLDALASCLVEDDAALSCKAEGDGVMDMVEQVARAMWGQRCKRAARQGIELEAWGDGFWPSANGIMEEARAAIEAMREPTEAQPVEGEVDAA